MIHSVRPAYPKAPKQMHIEGVVKLQILIGKTGLVREIELVSADPMFITAAVDAVKQWRYAPCKLNGEPIEVRTTIDVAFTLSQ